MFCVSLLTMESESKLHFFLHSLSLLNLNPLSILRNLYSSSRLLSGQPSLIYKILLFRAAAQTVNKKQRGGKRFGILKTKRVEIFDSDPLIILFH